LFGLGGNVNLLKVPISVPSSTDLESILSPDPIFSDLQLKEINYNAPGPDAGELTGDQEYYEAQPGSCPSPT